MLLAARICETWLTLHELSLLTGYGEASVSAQLRHLRKPRFGGFAVAKRLRVSEKRARAMAAALRGEPRGVVWEYQLQRQVQRVVLRRRVARRSARSTASAGKAQGRR